MSIQNWRGTSRLESKHYSVTCNCFLYKWKSKTLMPLKKTIIRKTRIEPPSPPSTKSWMGSIELVTMSWPEENKNHCPTRLYESTKKLYKVKPLSFWHANQEILTPASNLGIGIYCRHNEDWVLDWCCRVDEEILTERLSGLVGRGAPPIQPARC
jgi:hypothetical protein